MPALSDSQNTGVWRRRTAALLHVALLTFATTLASACKGVGDMNAPRPLETPVSTVVLSSERLTLSEGSTIALQATARDDRDKPLNDRRVFWSSADTSIATVAQRQSLDLHQLAQQRPQRHAGIGFTQ